MILYDERPKTACPHFLPSFYYFACRSCHSANAQRPTQSLCNSRCPLLVRWHDTERVQCHLCDVGGARLDDDHLCRYWRCEARPPRMPRSSCKPPHPGCQPRSGRERSVCRLLKATRARGGRTGESMADSSWCTLRKHSDAVRTQSDGWADA